METSAMDMTAVCSSNSGTKSEFNLALEKDELLLQENYELKNKVEVLERINKELENEIMNLNKKLDGKSDLDLSVSLDVISSKALFQENHELKKKIEVLEAFKIELESENNYLTQVQAKETSKLLKIQEELDIANSKIKHLQSSLEEERIQSQRLTEEIKEARVTKPTICSVMVPDQEQLNILSMQIEKLEIQKEDDQCSLKELVEENDALTQKFNKLSGEKQGLQSELSEVKEILTQKTTDFQNLNIAMESLREEKFVMLGEIQLLKASDTNAARGNSLFAEVEENRQKVAAQRELLKMKYLNLKKIFTQKQAENNKLKLEIVKIRREEKEDEKGVHHDYNTLIETYKQRVWELEERVKELGKENVEPMMGSESDSSQWTWVNSMVENARKDTRSLQEELDRRGSNYVTQGHQLLASQKENRKLKSTVSKLQSDIDELRLQLDNMKSAQENAQDQDGISPPATEMAVEYQKQKMVRFKEALSEQVKNISKNNSFSSDPDTSLREQNKLNTDANTSLVKVKKEENKENVYYVND